jgi:hypothetical protein
MSFQCTWIHPECSSRMTKHDQAGGKSRVENLQLRFGFGYHSESSTRRSPADSAGHTPRPAAAPDIRRATGSDRQRRQASCVVDTLRGGCLAWWMPGVVDVWRGGCLASFYARARHPPRHRPTAGRRLRLPARMPVPASRNATGATVFARARHHWQPRQSRPTHTSDYSRWSTRGLRVPSEGTRRGLGAPVGCAATGGAVAGPVSRRTRPVLATALTHTSDYSRWSTRSA